VFVYKILHRLFRAIPSNANDLHFAIKLFVHRLDRGRFKITRSSTGCPKPKRNRRLLQFGLQIDFTTINEGRIEISGYY